MPLRRARVPGSDTPQRVIPQFLEGRVTETVVALACGYECGAILSHSRVPTISRMQRDHRLLGALVVTWLVVHFVRYEREKAAM